MKLTSFTDYSLRVLMYLAVHPDRLCTVKEITESFQVSQNHIVKVVHSLSKNGYLNTKKGKNGGITLSRPPIEINIGDVVRKLEPDFNIVECFDCGKNKCTITVICKLKTVLFSAYKAFINELDAYTLADIVKNSDELIEIFQNNNIL